MSTRRHVANLVFIFFYIEHIEARRLTSILACVLFILLSKLTHYRNLLEAIIMLMNQRKAIYTPGIPIVSLCSSVILTELMLIKYIQEKKKERRCFFFYLRFPV